MSASDTSPAEPKVLTTATEPVRRAIKSFVKRTGRVTTGQARAFEALGPQFLVQYRPELTDVASFFIATKADSTLGYVPKSSENTKTVFEIGFGMGEATAHIAKALPDTRFLACEVHDPGVGALLKRLGEQGIGNVRIISHDAVEVIDHMLAEGSLDGIHVFFPDPWHKKRHNKRRLIQPPLVAKLARRLKPGGYIHCATDWQPYAEQMLEVLSAEPLLKNTSTIGFADKPWYRPLTKFENRGLKLGHGVWDVVFERT
jgi:tRNA (guanine-N7-)-methyltransferase